MTIATILLPMVSVGGLALLFGAVLGFSAKKFAVKTDPKVDMILEALPGANCAGCGFAGCAMFAQAVANGEAGYKDCPVGGASTAAAIAKIMGIDPSETNRKVAFVKCDGTCDNARVNYFYDGPASCIAASQLATEGNKSCVYGCLGLGSCKHVCPFGAITIDDGIAVIDRKKCTGCKKCVSICPKNLIELVPDKSTARVVCSSKDPGRVVKANCRAGCIGCKICQRVCPSDAMTVEDNIAHIDYDKCTSCMNCVEKCPTKAIKRFHQPNIEAPTKDKE